MTDIKTTTADYTWTAEGPCKTEWRQYQMESNTNKTTFVVLYKTYVQTECHTKMNCSELSSTIPLKSGNLNVMAD